MGEAFIKIIIYAGIGLGLARVVGTIVLATKIKIQSRPKTLTQLETYQRVRDLRVTPCCLAPYNVLFGSSDKTSHTVQCCNCDNMLTIHHGKRRIEDVENA